MKIRNPILIKIAAWFLVKLCGLLLATCRVEFHLFRPGHNAYSPDVSERFLFSAWHGSIVMTIFSAQQYHSAGLVSRHYDGSLVSHALNFRGIATVRGSSSRGGAAAVRQLMQTAADKHIVITPDGPRGPEHQMASGIVFLASHTGKAIIPSAFSCTRSWRIRGSWTETVIPKPFSKVFVVTEKEIRVPPDVSREQIKHYTQVAQEAMDRANAKAEQLATGIEPTSAEFKAAA